MTRIAAFACLLLAVGCGRSEPDAGPGSVMNSGADPASDAAAMAASDPAADDAPDAADGASDMPTDAASGAPELPAVAALPEFTVSGLSSGAYLAGQLHLAYSSSVSGAGIVAGGPWGCAQGDVQRALGTCISGDGLEVADLADEARALAAAGSIDALTGLQGDRVFVFHGTGDTVIAAAVARAAVHLYEAVGIAESDMLLVDDVPAVHGLPTQDSGSGCGEFAPPYLNDCDYDLAGRMLEHLYGPLEPPAVTTHAPVQFSQAPYATSGLGDHGYVFVPSDCGAGCRVHVFLHGCNQSAEQVGTAVVRGAGLNEWAETNRIVVLYPQAASSRLAPVNPLGCWDWWGYGGEDYLQRDAGQVGAIKAMVERLQARP